MRLYLALIENPFLEKIEGVSQYRLFNSQSDFIIVNLRAKHLVAFTLKGISTKRP